MPRAFKKQSIAPRAGLQVAPGHCGAISDNAWDPQQHPGHGAVTFCTVCLSPLRVIAGGPCIYWSSSSLRSDLAPQVLVAVGTHPWRAQQHGNVHAM